MSTNGLVNVTFSARPVLVWLALALGFATSLSARASLDVLYINRCSAGCTLNPGADNAINRTTSLISHQVTMPAFPHGDATFNATVACVRALLEPYAVNIVTADPGPVARREVILSGSSTTIGLPSLIYKDAPWANGTPIDNALSFAFAAEIGNDVEKLCWYTAQDLGTLYGLDFEYYCPDLMSTLSGCGAKTFSSVDAQCGTVNPRTCNVSGFPATQNSAGKLSVTPGLRVATEYPLNASITGNWFDPTAGQSGHGMQFEILPNNGILAIWFVFTPDGKGQNWLYSQGAYVSGKNTVTLPTYLSQGAKFPPSFNSVDVVVKTWGTMTFTFDDCNHGHASWTSVFPGYPSAGSFPIQRITMPAGLSCQ